MQAKFTATICATFGTEGAAWLQELPTILADCAHRHALTLLPPFPNLTFHYVAPAIRADGTDAVLKVGVPHHELTCQIAALRLYNGRGSVRLLEADAKQGMLLLERLTPGTPLTTLVNDDQDDQATSLAASVMQKLWQPAPAEHDFPTVADWSQGLERLRTHFQGGTGPFPVRLIEEAETLFRDLLASMESPVLLHGDLHHDNILAAKRESWLAIDPKGVVGESAYEVGALLRNLWEDRQPLLNPQRILERRVAQLAEELSLDRARVRGWGVAQATLSAWWCFEDGSPDIADSIALAEQLAAISY